MGTYPSSDVAPPTPPTCLPFRPAHSQNEVLPTQRTCFILEQAAAPNLPSLPEAEGTIVRPGMRVVLYSLDKYYPNQFLVFVVVILGSPINNNKRVKKEDF